MSRVIHVPATLDSATRKKDKSVKFSFTTMLEIPTSEFMVMDEFHQKAGHLMFKQNSFTEEEIPEEDVEEDIAKSQSVQLRDVLWVLYKAKGNDGGDKEHWNTFYRQNMQAIKSRVLETVHELEGK
jgi:hypothetical protein